MVQYLTIDELYANLNDNIIIDVRTVAEYELGHIHSAYNIPLFSNEERAIVGTTYVRVGKEEAVEQGLDFVGSKIGDIVREAKRISGGKPIILYCWRGGMRSGSVAWLLSTAGLNVKVIKGGYKAYRRDFETYINRHQWRFVTLGGITGCGKSEVLRCIEEIGEQMLDLEGLASHRGSAFGGIDLAAQPTTEQFTNLLHHAIRQFDPQKHIWCEGESMLIGHVYIPKFLFEILSSSTLIDYTIPYDERVERINREYGFSDIEELKFAFTKIERRLGSNHLKDAIDALDNRDIRTAIKIALVYYDKCYRNSLQKRSGELISVYEATEDAPLKSAEELKKIVNLYFENR